MTALFPCMEVDMDNLKTIKGKVRAVLQENEDARNDDMVLYLALCNLYQSVIFCGQFNTYLPFSLPAPAVCFYSLSLSYFFPALWTKLRYSRAGDIFNAAHRTVFSG